MELNFLKEEQKSTCDQKSRKPFKNSLKARTSLQAQNSHLGVICNKFLSGYFQQLKLIFALWLKNMPARFKEIGKEKWKVFLLKYNSQFWASSSHTKFESQRNTLSTPPGYDMSWKSGHLLYEHYLFGRVLFMA
ncbi:hypothetical protein EGW08_003662 [Elysia chlorotica]|uniref:Uncharacterized protein n=1 Tax=Elysia chlorotica TaxID=188477 RepID=A0A433U405_ELYCH|nr:hypothetical protein EGW08_003662 [Elysia chlorotica]